MRWALIAVAAGFLSLLVLVPLLAVFAQALEGGLGEYWKAVTDPEAIAAIKPMQVQL